MPLYIPRQAFDHGFWHDKYKTNTLLTRDKLDTARWFVDDRRKGTRYSATIPLSKEYGLRDMIIPNGFNNNRDIVISPLSTEEIEVMIQSEKNPKVREGLRAYATGRENYYYNSADDKNFVYEGFSQPKGTSK